MRDGDRKINEGKVRRVRDMAMGKELGLQKGGRKESRKGGRKEKEERSGEREESTGDIIRSQTFRKDKRGN